MCAANTRCRKGRTGKCLVALMEVCLYNAGCNLSLQLCTLRHNSGSFILIIGYTQQSFAYIAIWMKSFRKYPSRGRKPSACTMTCMMKKKQDSTFHNE